MREWLAQALALLSDSPLLQGLLAGLATFVLEDPTTIGCGLLVAEGKMAFATALIGVSAGIAIGDVGLYGVGRLLGPRVVGHGPLTPGRIRRASSWFQRNLVLAVLASRFVPGMRLPTYVSAGVLRAPLGRFVAVAVGASLVWTLVLLHLTIAVGERLLPLLGDLRWPVAVTALLLLALLQRRAARALDQLPAEDEEEAPVFSSFELWPPWFFYIPVFVYWLWLSVRHRSLTLPTAANPSIYSGGFIGETKSEILGLVPPEHADLVAAWEIVERPAMATRRELLHGAREVMAARGLRYPLVAKPDVGQRGDGVRPVFNDDELAHYLEGFPPGGRVMLQELVEAPAPDTPVTGGASELADAREAGLLYWRRPGEARGTIFSITLKLFPEVVGDGRRTLQQLVEDDPRASRLRSLYLRRFPEERDRVLEPGERRTLVFSGNHCQGTIFRDGTPLVTPALFERIDEIARSMEGFYFGRFDIRFGSLDAFLRGENLKIVEINGASGEATHIWDPSAKLADAYRTLFIQFRTLFEIGAANRARGHRPLGAIPFLREALAYRRLAQRYPETR
ncbi:MAG: DedA family protein [Acidobacteria bacterium]|nr:DedA family protein [Acidobacteriota bacterium]